MASVITDKDTGLGRLTLAGGWIITGVLVASALWAAFAPLESAVVAPGQIQVLLHRRVVQHPDGGIVREILVRDGDLVERGQPLLRLDDVDLTTRFELVDTDWVTQLAIQSRLLAERAGRSAIDLPEPLRARRHERKVGSILDSERRAFNDRRTMLREQVVLIEAELRQTAAERASLEQGIAASKEGLEASREELEIATKLAEEKYYSRARLLQQQRLHHDRTERLAQSNASLAETVQKEARLRRELITIREGFYKDVSQQLLDVNKKVIETQDKMRPIEDALKRAVVRAPLKGRVFGMRVNTIGGVIGPKEVLMEVVPLDDRLVVEAAVRPDDADDVKLDAEVEIQLNTLRTAVTPTANGRVTHISSDAHQQTAEGRPTTESYYKVEISIDPASLPDLKGKELSPGMPVTVLIKTGTRTALSYVTGPLSAAYQQAFREQRY
jgi:HlyD family secretion protein/epimerase transport system membrane fusion protein